MFSDTITIEGTATAQGNFDIETSCITNVTVDMLCDLGFEDDHGVTVAESFKEHGYKDVSCSVINDTVNYSVDFEYPGANKWYLVKMKNNGNIMAAVDTMKMGDILNNSATNIIKNMI